MRTSAKIANPANPLDGVAEFGRICQTRPYVNTGSKLRSCALWFAVWTAVGLAFGTHFYFATAGFDYVIPWSRTALIGLRDWYLWALLSMAIWRLVDHYPLERPFIWKRLLVYLVACVTAVLTIQLVGLIFSQVFPDTFGYHGPPKPPGSRPPPEHETTLAHFLLSIVSFKGVFDATIFWLFVSARYALNYSRRLQERYVIEAELKSSLTTARLQALKMQLQPHFLFNTLNAIAALIRQHPRTAETMIGSLSDLLRATLDLADRQEVLLSEELEFVDCYLSIEQLRFGDRLTVRTQVDPKALDALVPPMILQPIVENAVRHGVEPSIDASTLVISATIEGEELRLIVEDNGPGFAGKTKPGIGLQNTRDRLHQLYAGQERLLCDSAEGSGARVTLVLPLRHAAAPTPIDKPQASLS